MDLKCFYCDLRLKTVYYGSNYSILDCTCIALCPINIRNYFALVSITVGKKNLAVKNFGEFGKSIKICQSIFRQPSRLSRQHDSTLHNSPNFLSAKIPIVGFTKVFYRQVFLPYGTLLLTIYPILQLLATFIMLLFCFT